MNWETIQPIAKLIGTIFAAGGGAAVIVYLALKFLGKSAVEHWFKLQIEHSKNEHATALQRYKTKLDSLLSGAVKLQEHEHLIVPKVWGLLIDLRLRFQSLTNPFFDDKNLDSMTPMVLEEFLETTLLSESQKESIRSSDKKLIAYKHELFPMNVRTTVSAANKFREALLKNQIFIEPDLYNEFGSIHDKIWDLVLEYQSFDDSMTPERVLEIWHLQKKIARQIDEFGKELYERFSAQAIRANSRDDDQIST